VTKDPTQERSAQADATSSVDPAGTRLAVRLFAVALGVLLAGYMFLGRGFAHIGIGPIYVGETVLFLGVAVTAFVALRGRIRARIGWTIALLLAFAALGAARTLPYLGPYRMDALRDAVVWGYAAFALIVYLVADRPLLMRAFRTYGWVVPAFALWLPIAWNIFSAQSVTIDPLRQGSDVPLIVFKSGDMAVHVVGSIAFLVLGAGAAMSARTFAWRVLIVLPLVWGAFVAGTTNRGALITVALGLVGIVLLAPRSRSWLPVLAATVLFTIAMVFQGFLSDAGGAIPSPLPRQPPVSVAAETATPSPSESATESPSDAPSRRPGASASPSPTPGSPADYDTIANPSFELGPVDGETVEGWTPRGAMVSVLEGDARDGTRFGSMENPLGAYEATLTSSVVTFRGGEDIAVSAWVKALAGEPILEIYVNWYNRSGTLISSDFLNALDTEGAPSWREITGFLQAPPRATDAQLLFFEAKGRATLGIDDVRIRSGEFIVVPPAPIDGLPVANPDFELGPAEDGSIEGWNPRGAEANIVEGEAHAGASYASMGNPLGPYEATLTSNRFAIGEGPDISVSAWVKAIRGRPTLEIYVNWFDAAGEQISSVFLNSLATDGARTWQECAGALPAPQGATRAQILLFEATGGGATLGLDGVVAHSGDFIAEPIAPQGRPATLQQMIENILSVFGESADGGLEGTKQFRLAWWRTIIGYTVFGDHFWTGKGFGVNLADDDGFQSTADGSLRAPHNSHITVLARMGVPGFLLWAVVQGAFGVGLLRATRASRRAGDLGLAVLGAWLLAYWVAMMIDTSFDPYLEGPQGGIWFWVVFGAGLVVMRLSPPLSMPFSPRRRSAE
jgi:hypothetical protein